jgi:hypothetical protein
MRFYIFRDIYSGRIYGVRDYTPLAAMRKLSQVANLPLKNLVRVKKEHTVS